MGYTTFPWTGDRRISGCHQQYYMGNQSKLLYWLVVSIPFENISQIGNLPQIGVKIKIFETTTQCTFGSSLKPLPTISCFLPVKPEPGAPHLTYPRNEALLNMWFLLIRPLKPINLRGFYVRGAPLTSLGHHSRGPFLDGTSWTWEGSEVWWAIWMFP